MRFSIKEKISEDVGICRGCKYSHIFQQGEHISVRCLYYDWPIIIHRPVDRCNLFKGKDRVDRFDLEQIAYVIETKKGSKGVEIGFRPPPKNYDQLHGRRG